MTAISKRALLLGTTDGLYLASGGETELLGFRGAGEFRAPVVQDCREHGTLYAGATRAGMHRSRDGGRSWSETTEIARADGATDYPALIADGTRAYLSWNTARGYRLVAVEAAQ